MKTPTVFLSYVREDAELVRQIRDALLGHNIQVWVDKTDIAAGARWSREIRKAVANADFFIACFSKHYENRGRTYMNEELILAIEQLRRMPIESIWCIPILLSEC